MFTDVIAESEITWKELLFENRTETMVFVHDRRIEKKGQDEVPERPEVEDGPSNLPNNRKRFIEADHKLDTPAYCTDYEVAALYHLFTW
jgi:hypothetical protein